MDWGQKDSKGILGVGRVVGSFYLRQASNTDGAQYDWVFCS